MLDPLEGLQVFQIWREYRQIVGDINLAKKIDVKIFCFRYAETINGCTKKYFVREVAPFPRSGHML